MHSNSARRYSQTDRNLPIWLPLLAIIAGLPFLLRGAWLVATALLWFFDGIETTAVVTKVERYEQRIRKPAPSHLEPRWRGEYRFTLPDFNDIDGKFDSALLVGNSRSEFSVGAPLTVRYLRMLPAASRPAALDAGWNVILAVAMLLFGLILVATGLFVYTIGRTAPSSR